MNSPKVASLLAGNVLGGPESDFVVAEWQDPGGQTSGARPIAPFHLHRNDDEAWYVLEGVLHVKVGDEIVEAQAGAGVMVPRGTPHTYWNGGPGRLRYLLVMTGNIYRLIRAIHALPERTPAALKAVFQEHDSELL